MKVLVTGFEPTKGRFNASRALVNSYRDELPPELAAHAAQLAFAILPTDTLALQGNLEQLLAQHRPRCCVFTGQAPGRNRINLERFATNLKDFDHPDGSGNRPRGENIDATGPVAYRATLPGMDAMIERMNAAGIPAAYSNHAGNHLCNQVLYLALHHTEIQGDGPECGFLHIPLLPEQVMEHWRHSPHMPLATTRQALSIVLTTLFTCLDH
jgi:pyroglutamyl-peptidase